VTSFVAQHSLLVALVALVAVVEVEMVLRKAVAAVEVPRVAA
jgi:hypothetical protein